MFFLRITKYNPIYRDNNDFYTKSEWISISDIGNIYSNKMFTIEEYLKVENLYVSAIYLFLDYLKVEYLYIKELEKRKFKLDKYDKKIYDFKYRKIHFKVKNNKKVKINNLKILCKLILREKLWCKLKSEEIVIHFGYDYYMYIGTKKKEQSVIDKVKSLGLFVEEIESPYI